VESNIGTVGIQWTLPSVVNGIGLGIFLTTPALQKIKNKDSIRIFRCGRIDVAHMLYLQPEEKLNKFIFFIYYFNYRPTMKEERLLDAGRPFFTPKRQFKKMVTLATKNSPNHSPGSTPAKLEKIASTQI
jgi:hypothetical protein